MAQTGYTPILIYASGTASAVPSASNMTSSASGAELALNYLDGKLYYKNSAGTVTLLASTAGASGDVVGPSSATDNALVRFDSTTGKLIQSSVGVLSDAGVLTGLTGLTSSGNITLSALTATRVPYASTGGLLVDSANLTFNGTKLTVGGLIDSALTSGRVPYATTSGELIDSANLLYSGTDLTVYGLTIGRGAGSVSTNTAVGASALQANTTGANTVAVGYQAGYSNTTGNFGTYIGQQSFYSHTGNGTQNNTGVGYQTGYSTTTGYDNSFVGANAGRSNTTGTLNTAMGSGALNSNTTASNNTAVGYQAAYSSSGGNHMTAIGYKALYSSTVSNFNVAVGSLALTNWNNTGTDGSSVAVGYQALTSATTANNNTAVGYQAGYANTTGANNVFFGSGAGKSVVSNGNSVMIGTAAGDVTTGASNTFVGNFAGGYITSGAKNTILGQYNGNQGGLDIRTASNNIVLSDGDGNPRFYLNNTGKVYAPNMGSGAGTYTVKYNISTFELTADTSSAKYKDNIRDSKYGLSDIAKLKSRMFEYKDSGETDIGLIAEEVNEVIPELTFTGRDGTIDGVKYDRFVSVCIKAIQELNAQQAALKAEIDTLKGQA